MLSDKGAPSLRLGDDEFWLRHEGPPEWRMLNRAWEAYIDATVIRIVESLDENDLAEFVADRWPVDDGYTELGKLLTSSRSPPLEGHRDGASPPARRTSSASPCSTMIRFAGFRFTMTNVEPSGDTS